MSFIPRSALVAASLGLLLTGVLLYPALSAPWIPLQHGEKEEHPIDKALDACMEKNASTSGMVQCIDEAEKKWDRALNDDYQKLMGKLDTKSKATLKASQVLWIKFRDSEYKTVGAVYSKKDGTMFIPMRAQSIMECTKQRTLQLDGYLEVLGI